jgi:L-aspartate oxidase
MSAYFDALIIGSGIAGLNLARKLAQAGQTVFVCSKEAVTEGSSKYAQGGVAVVSPWNPEDKLESHIQDTLSAGKGLCNSKIVETVLSNAWERVEEFIGLGVKFDKDFYLEGSHSFKRVLHVADATGRALLKPLLDNVSCNLNIAISQGTEAIALLKNGDEVVGARLKTVSGEVFDINAAQTVLATGGFASLYKDHTTPRILTGDGLSLAYSAGAALENLEFIQFHPTVFFNGSKPFLISEVVRGAGAVLKNIFKQSFMEAYDIKAELATRDIVSRAIAEEMKKTEADYVYLDMTCWSKKDLEEKFPNIYHHCEISGYDLSQDLLPVRPAAHYCIGGIKTDIEGKTNIKGLYAIGECAYTGLHGANRLASNSLLECIVMPEFLANSILGTEFTKSNKQGEPCEDVNAALSYREINAEEENLKNIQNIMTKGLGIERNASELKSCLNDLKHCTEASKARVVAELAFKSALKREESRGCHFRSDFPKANSNYINNTLIQKSLRTH